MGLPTLSPLVAARAEKLLYYSADYFLQPVRDDVQQARLGNALVALWEQAPGYEAVALGDAEVQWLLQKLAWDSDYFGVPMVRLLTGLFAARTTSDDLTRAARAVRQHLATQYEDFYAFNVVPAEDVELVQALTAAGWRLVETRLTYYRNQLAAFNYPRHAVRAADVGEAAYVGRIAAAARNPYDRVHADAWFGASRADAYLAHYAENAVLGHVAATVLVPDEAGLAVDSFLAISDLESNGMQLSRVLLTAVGPANKGWHVKLVAETLHRAKGLGHEAVLMTTQATNRAVFRTCEKLGFRLAATSYVLACDSR